MIEILNEKEIEIIREAGRKLAKIMEKLSKLVRVGITTKQLDKIAEELILKENCLPAFKGYQKFPATLCTSCNQVLVHGVPSFYKLKEGDIISLDLGLSYQGYFSDMALTLPVGKIEPEKLRLIKVTKKALKLAIKKAKAGKRTGDVGNIIQRFVESQGFNVVRDLCGHGIGRKLHQEPKIPNFGKRRKGELLKEGMVVCIEPMVTAGDWKLKKSKDGFGFETVDGSLCAHFEHTVLIRKEKAQILTKI